MLQRVARVRLPQHGVPEARDHLAALQRVLRELGDLLDGRIDDALNRDLKKKSRYEKFTLYN